MKANEAPEKIYIFDNPILDFTKLSVRQSNDDIEYIRKDAFIEKVCKWFDEHFEDIGLEWLRGYNADEVIEDFKKYMEESNK